LRVGTSREVWTGIVAEPFVIGSVWGNLSGDNKATVTSFGTSFQFTDEPDDVWGVVSTGVNFFSPGANTSRQTRRYLRRRHGGRQRQRRHALQLVTQR
jgi:hypothetical protein